MQTFVFYLTCWNLCSSGLFIQFDVSVVNCCLSTEREAFMQEWGSSACCRLQAEHKRGLRHALIMFKFDSVWSLKAAVVWS